MYKPSTLQDAMDKAKEQELLVELLEKRVEGAQKGGYKGGGSYNTIGKSNSSFQKSQFNSQVSNRNKSTLPNSTSQKLPYIKKITPAEMAVRREKGLCYNCDEAFVPRHKCVKQQLFLIVGDENDEADTGGVLEENLALIPL